MVGQQHQIGIEALNVVLWRDFAGEHIEVVGGMAQVVARLQRLLASAQALEGGYHCRKERRQQHSLVGRGRASDGSQRRQQRDLGAQRIHRVGAILQRP